MQSWLCIREGAVILYLKAIKQDEDTVRNTLTLLCGHTRVFAGVTYVMSHEPNRPEAAVFYIATAG